MNWEVDARTVERALGGDSRAFEAVYSSLSSIIYNFAYRMLGARSAAEDVTQEVFVFLIERPYKYLPHEGSLRVFLCGVARNKIMHYLRRNGHAPKVSLTSLRDSTQVQTEIADDPLRRLLDKEFAFKVEEMIAQLPASQREVIILRELHELSYEEIGVIVGENINTVKSRVHRARFALASGLAAYVGKERRNLS